MVSRLAVATWTSVWSIIQGAESHLCTFITYQRCGAQIVRHTSKRRMGKARKHGGGLGCSLVGWCVYSIGNRLLVSPFKSIQRLWPRNEVVSNIYFQRCFNKDVISSDCNENSKCPQYNPDHSNIRATRLSIEVHHSEIKILGLLHFETVVLFWIVRQWSL